MRALWRRNDAWYRATPAGAPAQSHAPHDLVGRDQQYARQGDGAAAGAAERAPAGAGHRLRADLSELRAHHQRHRRGRSAPRRGPRLQHDDGRHVRAVRRAVCAGRDHPRPHAGRRRSRSWNTRSGQLGFKAIMLRGNQERPIPGAAEGIDPQKAAWYCDTIALDSPYDYEPFWQRCVELGVAVTQHSGSPRWSGSRLHQQLHLQPRRPLRRIEPRVRARRFPGRRRAAPPEPQFRLHGRRRELGVPDVRRHDRALGEAPARRAAVPEHNRPRRAAPAHRALRR